MFLLTELISMPRFKNINFYRNRLKIKLFLQNLQTLRAPPPDTPKHPPIADFNNNNNNVVSYIARFLRGSRSKALYSTNTVQQYEKVAH